MASALDCLRVHPRNGIVGGHQLGVVAGAAGEHLAAQPGILIHLEHVDAGVRNAGVDEHIERLLPGGEGLAGKTGDQIHVEVANSSGTEAAKVIRNNCPAVQAAARLRFAIDEGLHAQTHAVHARSNQRVKRFVGNLTWRALDGDFGIRVEIELRPHGGKETRNQLRSQQAGGSTAQVNGVDAPGQIRR